MQIKPFVASVLLSFFALSASAYSIWPVPRTVTNKQESLDISSQITVVADEGVDQLTISRAEQVLEKAGIDYTVSSTPSQGANLYIGVNGGNGTASQYAADHNVPLSVFSTTGQCFDPHVVYVDGSSIVIIGDEEGSAFYGFATLEQIFEQREGNTLPGVIIEDYAHAKYRGLVEGFYGHPWSMESRLNILDHMMRYKMNYYVYGPKADPYHAGNWRVNYPETVTDDQRKLGQITTSDIQQLATHAAACKVDFVWAVHPTLGSYYISLDWVDDIMTKFQQLYSLGVRHFGVSVDDMSGHPTNQAQLPDKVQQAIDEKWNTADAAEADRVGNVLFVPTCYALNYGATYSLTPIQEISSKVEVAFTGYDCFSNVRASSFGSMAEYIGRDPIFWWNNPVNDDHDTWLYMHGLTARWTIEQTGAVDHMRGFLLNPMNQGQVSKICNFSAADYSWNPDAYNEQSSWEQALKSIVKTDENVKALKDFIRVMSAYTTTETTSPEGEELKPLYQDFQSNYSSTSVPECTELKEAMQNCYDACLVIRTFKDSEDPDLALFYTDIEPWLDKVQDMARIVLKSIEFMTQGASSLDHWTEYSDILALAQGIHTNHKMSVLEGSGTSTYESMQEVHPTPKYLDPFIDFLAAELVNFAPQLPERDMSPKVITNLSSLSGVSLKTDEAPRVLSGLNGISLKIGEYVGVCLNRIQTVTLTPPALPDGVVLEYSISGKEWQQWNGEETIMAYFRLRGNSAEPVELTFDQLAYSVPVVSDDTTPEVSTNMGTWGAYNITNVIDGDNDTYFWSNNSQSVGDYVLLDFGASNPRGNISLVFNSGDHPTGTVEIQLSDNNSTWSTVASFSESDLTNNTYSCDAKGASARYVRLYLSSVSGGNWFQLAEFSVNSQTSATTSVAVDSEGNAITQLNDISLTTHYAGNGKGYIEYQFIENIDIHKIHIYHNSHFTESNELPVIEVYSNGEWVNAGVLDAVRTIIKVTDDMRHVTKLRISWTEGNAPDIYEVYPVGPDYVQPASEYAGIDSVVSDSDSQIMFSTSRNILTVKAPCAIRSIEIADMSGRIITNATPNADYAVIPVSERIVIATVHLENGSTATRKITM